jgi:hypothetical protein
MMPSPEMPAVPPDDASKFEDADFADEAGPKETEFSNEADAKDITSGGFDPIP